MELRSRSGSVLGVAGETYDSIRTALPEVEFKDFPLSAGIDRYGKTMFNSTQMRWLAEEFERMLSDAPKEREKLLQRLIEFCNEGAILSECELWITGD